MTQLQRLAFDRIETINKECLKLLPSKFSCHSDGSICENYLIEIEPIKLLNVVNLLHEQHNLIEALNVEDGGGYDDET